MLKSASICVLAAFGLLSFSRAAFGHGDQSTFELGGALSGSWSDSGQPRLANVRLPARYFVFDGANLGLEARFWPSGAYPLSQGSGSAIATGIDGQIYFINRTRLGAYVGGALLWAPSHAQLVLSPEVGVRYFITRKIAIGASYEILTDLGSFLLSLQPSSTSGSTQSLGVGLVFEI